MKFDHIQEFQIWNHNSNQTFNRSHKDLDETWKGGCAFPTDGSNAIKWICPTSGCGHVSIVFGGTPAEQNDGGMGQSGGEERARFERNQTHLYCKKFCRVSVTHVVQRVEAWTFFPLTFGSRSNGSLPGIVCLSFFSAVIFFRHEVASWSLTGTPRPKLGNHRHALDQVHAGSSQA